MACRCVTSPDGNWLHIEFACGLYTYGCFSHWNISCINHQRNSCTCSQQTEVPQVAASFKLPSLF